MEFGLFLSFLGFFFTAVILVVAFLYLYALVTSYDDYNVIVFLYLYAIVTPYDDYNII
mgnify:CR=1 FL=1